MQTHPKIVLPADRYFNPDPRHKEIAQHLYSQVVNLPLLCPHGHVDPRMFADPAYSYGSPTQLLLISDHYVFRMLYSQGIPLEQLGLSRHDGGETELDHRKIWQIFAENFYLFRGTPTGMWLTHELYDVFGVEDKLTGESASDIYDQIADCLQNPNFHPRRLFERFNIEVLTTTDAATDPLKHHQTIRESGWSGQIRPTFRPDGVVNLDVPGWRQNVETLSQVSGLEVNSYPTFIRALENRRAFFKQMGATAADHGAVTPFTEELSLREAEVIFYRALKNQATLEDARRFTGHMLIENARMSVEDGLVMQLHAGSQRNHNPVIFERFGPDMGADIPLAVEYTRNLQPLLHKYGNHPHFRLILFTLDETTYSRELAPLAGHYPAVKLGPPWWFSDSWNGLARFFDQAFETAGLYNTVGFNDDTRAFPSLPARHDLWRRAAANWVAGLVVRHIVDEGDGLEMVRALAYDLAKKAYRF